MPLLLFSAWQSWSGAATHPDGVARNEQQAQELQQTWAKDLGVPVEEINSLGMTLALIPPGEFLMGSPASEAFRCNDEGPQHRVRIGQPFYLAVHEVTQEAYRQLMDDNPSAFSRDGRFNVRVEGLDTSRFPADHVSWADAVEFCRRLSERERRTYRLPTEAEWEYACRARTSAPFHFGNILNGSQANCDGNHPYGTSNKGPYLARPATVGSYPANAFGLHDMHGNVWEWCADWFHEDYYENSPIDDPQGPAAGAARVRRGGSWADSPWACRAAVREGVAAEMEDHHAGFRVVLVHQE